MTVAHAPDALERRARAVAIGTFDGVHLGHRAVIGAAVAACGGEGPGRERVPTVVTFHPHPRTALGGNRVQLISTLARRLELLAACGVEDVLVVEFTPELAALAPEDFAAAYLEAIGAEVVVAGAGFRFGRGRSGDLELLRTLGFDAREVPLVAGASSTPTSSTQISSTQISSTQISSTQVSSTQISSGQISSTQIRLLAEAGDVVGAARLLGRPVEVDGTVVPGEQRGGTLGFPTANLLVEPDLLVPAFGIYAGAVGDRRAAVSIGVNPHYGGTERRIEAYVLDWTGDLYGDRLVVELWRRLREERAFASEADLIAQIARDVDETRAARRPGGPAA